MNQRMELSNNTQEYLERFYSVLDTMINGMTAVQPTDSVSMDFIHQMIPHHRAAIQMSENLLRYTTNIPLQNIALNIVSAQTKSIEDLMQADPSCAAHVNTTQELTRYWQQNNQILDEMFHEMKNAYAGNSIDVDFIHEMIPHHRGAIRMSENTLRYPLCPQLIPIIDAILTSQRRGIAQMQQLLSYIRYQ